jgi:hypothetical protein
VVDAYNRAIVGRRGRTPQRIDLAELRTQAAGQIDVPIAQLVGRARANVVVLLRDRPGWIKQLAAGPTR